MKCQKCIKVATLHITEVLAGKGFEELHLCEECAKQFFADQAGQSPAPASAAVMDPEDTALVNLGQCEICGIKFVEFRNSGRFGCPNDYDVFGGELVPLLESIHGRTRHAGKTPRRLPVLKDTQQELSKLRKQLHRAVSEEAYEEAAGLRDRIRQLENI